MITYLTGDATQPVKKPALIMHVCNDVGKWGAGFVLALSKRWPTAQIAYHRRVGWPLRDVDFIEAERDVWVANMIAQHGIRKDQCGNSPIRYWALAECLKTVKEWTELQPPFTIHCPRIGCGLAGGSWSVVEPLIEFYLKDRDVYVYDLPEGR